LVSYLFSTIAAAFSYHGKAEEEGNGKVVLLEKGAYEGMDVCLMYPDFSLL
jgi:hypothetical protein